MSIPKEAKAVFSKAYQGLYDMTHINIVHYNMHFFTAATAVSVSLEGSFSNPYKVMVIYLHHHFDT